MFSLQGAAAIPDYSTRDVYFTPRKGSEMKKAVPGAELAVYSRICELVSKYGAPRIISHMFSKSPLWIILLQDPQKLNSGHWMGLSIHPGKKEIYFFSTYGGKPDFEKNKWLKEDDQIMSGQNTNALNDGLKEMAKNGWTIHYNDHPYQFEGDGSATCGIWTAAFLNSGLNPDQFYLFNLFHNMGAEDYFRAYF